MDIELKNKFLYIKDYKIKCTIGKRGITSKKVEGDRKTPKGTFRLKSIFYRKDRIMKIKSSLKKHIIRKLVLFVAIGEKSFIAKRGIFIFKVSPVMNPTRCLQHPLFLIRLTGFNVNHAPHSVTAILWRKRAIGNSH